jgi:predicted nuclease of predicted toxin-antitoxin system
VRFLVDENLSEQIVAGLSGFGEHVEHVLETFDPGTADEAWLEYAGTHHLTVVTRDL